MTDDSDAPQTPTRDEPDNEDLGTTEEVAGGGYPEESPGGTDADDEPADGRKEQPQGDRG